MKYLPHEILYTVCTQVWNQRDFDTLFNCACSGNRLAIIAVPYLYRMQRVPHLPAHSKLSQEEWIFMKKAALWRTIILSSLGKTLYPYCQYIRTLDLRGLHELLIELRDRTNQSNERSGCEVGLLEFKSCKDFFQAELAQFEVHTGTKVFGPSGLNVPETIDRIGEAITKQTPLVEVLTGKVLSSSLSRWIPRLPKLTHLKPWHSRACKGNGTLIRLHCPSFQGLDIRECNGSDADQGLAAFLNELRPQSLASFGVLWTTGIGLQSLQALSCHGESLVDLNLNVLTSINLPRVSLLKGCTNLVSLSLGTHNVENLDNDSLLAMAAWLKECKKLQNLYVARFVNAPALLSPLLLENSIHLTSFCYDGALMPDTEKFYQALANQTSLRSLSLQNCIDVYTQEVVALVESLSKLVNLTDLRLRDLSSFFVDGHIMQLASNLPKLEALSTCGCRFTDAIWGQVSSLGSLQSLVLTALTSFTTDGILDFIERLGPGNKSLSLFVAKPDTDEACSWVDQELIQKRIAEKVGGTFRLK